ncbi:FixH family protein [Marichromatium gracile]|uniref:FixH family protein n=1 Tax=Marichromatium gracile TaxID=1048 RepID=UPI001F2BB3BA|nr:FixH family protein [Marichromatium gracile]MCF1182742.1 FixH family protein [Marichromatium gracile]
MQIQSGAVHSAQPLPAWRSPWVIAWVGLIVVVLLVNLLMVYLAVATNPGLVNADYYERGQDYERTLVSRRARDPGWVMQADIPPLQPGRVEAIRLFLVDRAGQPVEADAVTLHAYRPADAARDFSVPMRREGAGRYVAEVAFPLPGVWDTLIAVGHGEDEYSLDQRLEVGMR